MARIRTIKPEFFTHEELSALSPWARLLFIGLWTLADREGRLEERPKRIKLAVFPWDDVDVAALLLELARRDLIVRYQRDGKHFISIPTFLKHQRPNLKEPQSEIPAPDIADHQESLEVAEREEQLMHMPARAGTASTSQGEFREMPAPTQHARKGREGKGSTAPNKSAPDPRFQETKTALIAEYESRFGKYDYHGVRDSEAIKVLITLGTFQDIQATWRFGLSIPPGQWPGVATIAQLRQKWSDLRKAMQSAKPAQSNQEPTCRLLGT